MGYHTEFWGHIDLAPHLSKEQADYLRKFNESRRMKRDPEKLAKVLDASPLMAYSFGNEGEYYVGGEGYKGQEHDESVINGNEPPSTQPGLWCQWVPNNDGSEIIWDGGEKFYEYVEWMTYIVRHFLVPWKVVANGIIDWDGEESDDRGRIVVENNVVTEKYATLTWA